MFWFVIFFGTVLFGLLIVYYLIQGVAVLGVIAYFILKPIFRLLGRQLDPIAIDIAARADERFFGISRELEIVSDVLTDDFKATKPMLAPDIWHDGRRLYFEVGEKSYSVKMDLEGARKRKNELLSEHSQRKFKAAG